MKQGDKREWDAVLEAVGVLYGFVRTCCSCGDCSSHRARLRLCETPREAALQFDVLKAWEACRAR